jgi:hypothetical protein
LVTFPMTAPLIIFKDSLSYYSLERNLVLALAPVVGSLLAAPLALFILHQGLRGALGMSVGRALGALAVFLFLQTLVAALIVGGFLALLGLGLLFLG